MPAPSPGQPSRLGPYTLLSKLGQGGMGEVHLAHDTRLDRNVALKLLPAELHADPERRSRFLREARAAAQLNHPNVTQIFDVGEAEGQDYIALELVDGRTLADLLAERPLALAEVVELALPLADALAYAHERGVLHRDLKTSNVMVTKRGHPKLLDFGLAKLLQESSNAPAKKTTTLTMQGAIFGTPAAMSPEQALGKPLDQTSDVFSFGSLLYEMAGGRPAFSGGTVMEVMDAVIHKEPPPLERVRPDLPADFAAIVGKALRKESRERYQTMADLAADLRHWKRKTESGLVPVASERAGRRRAVIALLLTVAALALGWWLSGFLAKARSPGNGDAGKARAALAVLPLTNIGGGGGADDGFAVGLHSDIITRLAKLASLKVISRESVLEYAGSKKNLRQIGEELGVASVLTGEVQRAGNELRLNVTLRKAATDENLWAESYNRELTARGILSVQSEIAESVATALAASLSPTERANLRALPTTNDKAYELYLAGSPLAEGPTGDDNRRSLAVLTQAVELDPNFAQAWASLGIAHAFAHWRYDINHNHLDRGFAAARQSLAIAGNLAEGHVSLGTCHYVSRDYDAALAEFELAERAQPGMPMALKMKGYLHRRIGKWEQSIAEMTTVIDQSPRDAFLLSNQAISLTYLHRYREAEALYLRSRAAGETLENLGAYVVMCLSRDGDARSVGVFNDYLAAHPEQRDMQPLQEIVRIRIMGHDYGRIRADLEGAPERMASQIHDHPKSLLLAIADDLAGERDKAAAEYEAARQSLAAWLAVTPDDHRLQASMGFALAGLGRRDEALAAGRRAVELLPVERDALVGCTRRLDLCLIAARAGALDEAMQYLEEYLSKPSLASIRALALDPRLEPLRERPRFKALEQAFAAK